MKTVNELIVELSNFPADKQVRFFLAYEKNMFADLEMKISEYDQDESGNPTFLMEYK
jgi:hypothetical protein